MPLSRLLLQTTPPLSIQTNFKPHFWACEPAFHPQSAVNLQEPLTLFKLQLEKSDQQWPWWGSYCCCWSPWQGLSVPLPKQVSKYNYRVLCFVSNTLVILSICFWPYHHSSFIQLIFAMITYPLNDVCSLLRCVLAFKFQYIKEKGVL